MDNIKIGKTSRDDFFSVKFITSQLWKKKVFIFLITLVFSLFGAFYSYSLPNIYISKTILAPNIPQQSQSASLGQLGGLASFAGINLGNSGTDEYEIAIQKLTTLNFFESEILPKIHLPDLVAVNAWLPKENKVDYKKDIYNQDSGWVGKYKLNDGDSFNVQEAHRIFLEKNLIIEQNNENSFVIIKIEHQSPYIAKEWVDITVNAINDTMRDDQRKRSNTSLNFLNQQITSTNLTEIKQELSLLIKSEIEKLMFIESHEDYIFKVVEPAYVPDLKSKPQRFIILVLTAFFGLLCSCFYILFGRKNLDETF